MRLLLAALAASAASAAVASASAVSASAVTPLGKVLQLMKEMKAKGIAEMEAEETRFSAFRQFCAGTSAEKTSAVERAGRRIEKLSADASKAQADVQEAERAVAELEEDLARWRRDETAVDAVRAQEHTDYRATHQDYADTIDACDRAISAIRERPGKIAQELLQARVRHLAGAPPGQRRAFASALLQGTMVDKAIAVRAVPDLPAPPEAYAYEAQSGSVLELLGQLRQRFRNELTDLEREEMASQHSYEAVVQRLKEQSTLAEKARGHKEGFRTERAGDLARAQGDLTETTAVKSQDEAYLGDLKSLCSQKESDFEARKALRGEEIKALGKAIDIMSSESVAASRLPGGKPSSSFLQERVSRISFLQMLRKAPYHGSSGKWGHLLSHVASLLDAGAKATGSQALARVAKGVREEPFAKVKSMIRDLLVRLMEEANTEANHKAWCDTELATNGEVRNNKMEAVEELASEADGLAATHARLAQEIADLQAEVAELDAAVAAARKDRQEEEAENAKTVREAKSSQAALAEAMAVLRDFYAQAREAIALVQQAQAQTPADDAPETFDVAYQGMQGESKGVIGLLEVIASDFARLEVTTENSEREAVAAFERFVAKSGEDKAVKQTEAEHKTAKLETTDQLLASTKRSLARTQAELEAAQSYYEKLRPSCVDSGVTFEERVKQREAEIVTLRDAYKILSGEDVPSLSAMKSENIGRS